MSTLQNLGKEGVTDHQKKDTGVQELSQHFHENNVTQNRLKSLSLGC